MKRHFCLLGSCLALGVVAWGGGCAQSVGDLGLGHGGDDGGAGGGDDGGASDPPHALGIVMLGESHAPSGGESSPIVVASFVPDAAAAKTCTTRVAGCDYLAAPKCGSGGGNACASGEVCSWDKQCQPTCVKECIAQCAADEECYFASGDQTACRKRESFDAGALAFAGTTTPITLFPPYSYKASGSGAPFLAGASIEVQASGATGAGYDKFDEKFTATTFLQTSPALDKIDRTTVFGSGSVPVGWAAGQDTVKIMVTGAGGVVTCNADDTKGHYDIPRDAMKAAMGTSGGSYVAISVSRQRTETRKNETTHGTMSTAKVQPVGWLALTTASSESASFQGCSGTGETMCSDGCYDTQSDPQHCGSCTNACSSGQTCSSGTCSGGSGQTCDQCTTQSETGACSSQYNTCVADSDCTAFASCVNGCAQNDQTCINNCKSAHTTGASEFASFADCVCNTACYTPCAVQCGH